MKILFVTGNYLPGKNGGIENYTGWLASLLLKHNFEVEVAALNLGETENYIHDSVFVNNLKKSFPAFETLLKRGNFDICHFQEYSENGIGIPWFKKAKEYCSKVFFTFHLPYLTCYKLDFRYKGIHDCNTFSDLARCTACVITEKTGYKNHRSEMIVNSVEGLMKITGLKNKLEKRILLKHHQLNELIASCDQIFTYAGWFKKILAENGYNDSSIKKIPYKTKTEIGINRHYVSNKAATNKILFVGRIQQQKGLLLLCKAMNEVAIKNIQLDVYGDIVDETYYHQCLKDHFFNFKGTTSHIQLLEVLHQYDFLVLPSVFTEMHSMIIKDAFYEKLPVIASTAKGNMDAIQDGVNGFLFEYDNAKDLTSTINKAYNLKKKGWKPVFTYPENPEEDTKEIISYYC